MSANFFSDALRKAMATRHFNQAQLADFLKVDPAYVSRWLKGSSPRIDQMRQVLTMLGWDIERARPDYDPFEDAIVQLKKDAGSSGAKVKEKGGSYKNVDEVKKLLEGAAETHKRLSHPPVLKAGKLDASKGQVVFEEGKDAEKYEGLSTLFPTPEYADNELFILDVEGNELAPLHPEGSKLLIRRVLKLSAVPDETEVIMESTKKPNVFHLRRLVRIADKRAVRVDRLIGIPVAPGQDYLFFKPREVRIHSAIVGTLNIA